MMIFVVVLAMVVILLVRRRFHQPLVATKSSKGHRRQPQTRHDVKDGRGAKKRVEPPRVQLPAHGSEDKPKNGFITLT